MVGGSHTASGWCGIGICERHQWDNTTRVTRTVGFVNIDTESHIEPDMSCE